MTKSIHKRRSQIENTVWTNNKKFGPPDDEGMYLCAFSDGSVETFPYDPGDKSWWRKPSNLGVMVTHWMEVPGHPDTAPREHDPQINDIS